MILVLAQAGLDSVGAISLLGVCILLLAASTIALWLVVVRLGRMEGKLVHLAHLDEIQKSVHRFQEDSGALDVRRLEHVLIDIRDGQKRVEDRTLAVLESVRGGGRSPGSVEPVAAGSASALADRIVTRLLALGYERVQLVTPLAKIAELCEGQGSDGEISVEARRDGAACKGRILVQRGAIADVQLQSAYSTFP